MLRWLLLLSFAFPVSAAEKPALDQIYPAGACRGTTNEVSLLGKFDPWPPKIWASVPGIDFQFTTNKGKATVAVANNTPLGPGLVRAYNDEGAGDLRIFVVSDTPELQEIEPNNYFAKAQIITNAPGTINGRLEKNGDVDSFRFEIKGGQWLDAALDCYTLLAKLDPVLRLVTTNGYQLAWNHDFSSLDPRLVWQAPYDTTVVLQVFGFIYPADSDIRLSGGSGDVYRLHLAISETQPVDLRESATEKEPNNSSKDAANLEIPGQVTGVICPSGDTDWFKVNLKKDQEIEARVQAASLGSPLDAWMAIESEEDGKSKELSYQDDADNSRDPRIEWKAPADGTFYFAVGSKTHQGNTDCRYHLDVRTLRPGYTVTSGADAQTLTPGTTNAFKLHLKRFRGFTNELVAAVKGLPEGVSAADLTLPAKDGETSLSFMAATNAPAFNGPFQILVTDQTTKQQQTVPFEMVSRSENNGVPGGYLKLLVEKTDQLWLTVKRQPAKEPDKKQG
jgi:hypothetical protein